MVEIVIFFDIVVGIYNVLVLVDVDDKIFEVNEGNNLSVMFFIVIFGDKDFRIFSFKVELL